MQLQNTKLDDVDIRTCTYMFVKPRACTHVCTERINSQLVCVQNNDFQGAKNARLYVHT